MQYFGQYIPQSSSSSFHEEKKETLLPGKKKINIPIKPIHFHSATYTKYSDDSRLTKKRSYPICH